MSDWAYNLPVRAVLSIAVLLLTVAEAAQIPTQSCPSDKPVDDIINEIHKSQSKKNTRNKNPLPDTVCLFGWCRQVKQTTPPLLEGGHQATARVEAGQQSSPASDSTATPNPDSSSTSSSSSKSAVDRCNERMEVVLDAAHNVEVGDYYFGEKNYRAALLRYKDAADAKPDDNAIAVRLGRASEKLNDIPAAIEHYTTAAKLTGPEKWTEEARAALARLQSSN